MHKKVVVVGAGSVAYHLIRVLLDNTVNVVQIFNRTLSKAQELANNYNINYTDKISEIVKADIYIICTADKAISEISYYIPYEDCLVVHTSGSTAISALKGKYRKGVFYPLQTFSKRRTIKDIPFLIEAEFPEDELLLLNLGKRISEDVRVTDSDTRLKIHMAAIWANNFTNHMYYIANEICKKQNIPFDMLKPLIKETAGKIEDDILPYEAQTGPARRNEELIIKKHLEILEKESDSRKYQIYQLLTDSIFYTYNDKL
ncbi:DUF2520 domain-containing protein [Apibacter raozihei]|uniref:Rossmann-like and DUF2520 domain-containing protein n=1 Tax=Apibacter TaxID=1778601 RepID=UPI000FE30BB5|nr:MULTISPECIES: Rossmann-like and DUF2520 domain-containing protein [Apibacter]